MCQARLASSLRKAGCLHLLPPSTLPVALSSPSRLILNGGWNELGDITLTQEQMIYKTVWHETMLGAEGTLRIGALTPDGAGWAGAT